VEDSDSFTG
jgi:hypothetical protein